jgi:hypothetical protein
MGRCFWGASIRMTMLYDWEPDNTVARDWPRRAWGTDKAELDFIHHTWVKMWLSSLC